MSQPSSHAGPGSQAAYDKAFFGHPRGLATLFFTEMWERFAYYGMRALLILFMTAATDYVVTGADGTVLRSNPGLGFDVTTAAAIYGMYTALVYILTLPGGWVADNLWGQRKAVFVGGCFIAAGQITMVLPYVPTFFAGLVLVIFGTGLLKPNVSTVVGELYPEGGARRDAGFSIFYMGINLGAWIGPLLTGFFGENYNWHWGFGVGAIGMILGLVQYKMGDQYLGDAGYLKSGDSPEQVSAKARKFFAWFFGSMAAIGLFAYSVSVGIIPVTLTQIATALGYSVLILVALYFVYLWTMGGHTTEENKKLAVIFWLFLLIAVFWSGFEQAGSSLTVFARDLTDRTVFGWVVPASYFQSINPVFIIIMAPLFGSLWVFLDKVHKNPPLPLKAGLGLLFLAAGFFVIAWGAANATNGNLVTPAWLIVTYFLHTTGELCISPIGLSAITKLSPQQRVGQMMGIWFVGAALGNLFAGLVAGRLADLPPAPLFQNVAIGVGVVGIIGVLLSPAVKKLMGDVK
jgi:POT family proton-dependent oligopeptide transporter